MIVDPPVPPDPVSDSPVLVVDSIDPPVPVENLPVSGDAASTSETSPDAPLFVQNQNIFCPGN